MAFPVEVEIHLCSVMKEKPKQENRRLKSPKNKGFLHFERHDQYFERHDSSKNGDRGKLFQLIARKVPMVGVFLGR